MKTGVISEIMTINVISAHPEDSIICIAETLTKNRIHGLPVVEGGKVVGIITESDFFIKNLPSLYLPSYIEFLKQTKMRDIPNNKMKTGIKDLIEAKARDIMTSPCITASSKSQLTAIIELIKNKKLTTLPIVDEENNLVGIVSTADIIKLL
jgi:CBS domain-containing protein